MPFIHSQADIPGDDVEEDIPKFLLRALQLPRVHFGAAVYLVVSLVCARLPLVNYLGYEFSFVVALAATWVAGWISIRSIGARYRAVPNTAAGIESGALRVFREALAVNLLLIALPLALMVVNALFVKNCSLLLGLGFYVCIPVVTAVFATCLGFFCVVHYRFPLIAYGAMFSATIGYVLAIGYWTPAIFSYNLFYGFFPGLTYDELLELRWPLVAFRLLTLFVALLLVLMTRLLLRVSSPGAPVREKGVALVRALLAPHARAWTGICIVMLGTVYAFRCELRFESTPAYVQRALGTRLETAHLTIYYDSSSVGRVEIRRIAQEQEFRLSQAWDAFVLPHRGRIASYLYPSASKKMELIGAGGTSIAKPWSREVHISRASMEAVLKHELIHVVAGIFGAPVIHASLSPGLTEGLAMALEGEWGTRTLHEMAAAVQREGIAPDMKALLSIRGFFSQSSSMSYVLAGSFCRYLIDRFGIRKFTQVYAYGEYEDVYGRTLGRLLTDWSQFLGRMAAAPGDKDLVDATFRRPPIFGKVCARVVAERNESARAMFAARDYSGAAAQFAQSYAEGHGYEALSGWLVSAHHGGSFDVLTAAYDTIIANAERPAEYLPLFLPIGDAYWAKGEPVNALRLYNRLERADLSQGLTESAAIRSLAVDDQSCAEGLLRYVLSTDPDSVRVRLLDSLSLMAPDDPVVRFLRGKALARLERWDDALQVLEGFSIGESDIRLEAARRIAVGQVLVRLGRYQDAKAIFWTSLNTDGSDASRALVDGWIERCDWMTEHVAP